jgi:hypothetical protein
MAIREYKAPTGEWLVVIEWTSTLVVGIILGALLCWFFTGWYHGNKWERVVNVQEQEVTYVKGQLRECRGW